MEYVVVEEKRWRHVGSVMDTLHEKRKKKTFIYTVSRGLSQESSIPEKKKSVIQERNGTHRKMASGHRKRGS